GQGSMSTHPPPPVHGSGTNGHGGSGPESASRPPSGRPPVAPEDWLVSTVVEHAAIHTPTQSTASQCRRLGLLDVPRFMAGGSGRRRGSGWLASCYMIPLSHMTSAK